MKLLLAALAVMALSCLPAQGQAIASYKITWMVVTVHPHTGVPLQVPIPDRTKFANKDECNEFGKEFSLRAADWMRGLMRVDWDYPVLASPLCEPAGNGRIRPTLKAK